jgi:hypothetical protein
LSTVVAILISLQKHIKHQLIDMSIDTDVVEDIAVCREFAVTTKIM